MQAYSIADCSEFTTWKYSALGRQTSFGIQDIMGAVPVTISHRRDSVLLAARLDTEYKTNGICAPPPKNINLMDQQPDLPDRAGGREHCGLGYAVELLKHRRY